MYFKLWDKYFLLSEKEKLVAVKKSDLEVQYRQYFKDAEKVIDECLDAQWRPGSTVKVGTDLIYQDMPVDVKNAVLQHIVRVYTEAGWEVEWITQRSLYEFR